MGISYGQFCPVAKAAEILCERWAPIVLRELMFGSKRFNELARGAPLMSRSMLAQRLRDLRDAGVVSLRTDSGNNEYVLTASGEALRPAIEAMGMWAQRFGQGRISDTDLDDGLLIWSLRRALRRERLPGERAVLQFDFRGLPAGRVARKSWWLVATRQDVDVCQKDPGFEVDVTIDADLRTLVNVWLGFKAYGAALKEGSIRVSGDRALKRAIPDLFPFRGEFQTRMYVTAEPLPI